MTHALLQVVLYAILALPLVGAYALLGLGITVIYQASRVLNLAHGAMAMIAAYATYDLNSAGFYLPHGLRLSLTRLHLVLPLAVVAGVVAGAVAGLVIERFFVRRLRSAGPTTQTVGTVAVLLLVISLAARQWGTLPVKSPQLFPRGAFHIGGGFVPYSKIGIFPVAIAGAALLFALFQYTNIGLAMRGAAQNRRGAALRGIDPDRTAAMAWLLGGAFAGMAGILLAGSSALDPYSISLGVLPAFVAALIGGLESMPGVVIGAAVIGLIQGMVPLLARVPAAGKVFESQGAPQLVLGIVALVVMALRGVRLSTADTRGEAL